MNVRCESDYCCKPLDSLNEIQSFIDNPPIWRSLCRPLTLHSKYAIKNSEVDPKFEDITLEGPLTYCHFEPDHDFDNTRETLHDIEELPKLLVCHDYNNGYHDESHINGTANMSAYTFYNWAAVDVFCYFSHHLVTVPPLAHINAAHAHGVKVIGTFITESATDAEFRDRMFTKDEETDELVSSLVAIAKTLKFEGWLINIENQIAEPLKLLKFMTDLHTALHREVPGAKLIWYDSVTKTGELRWQNRLNQLNRPFFDACDGIFTNYAWRERDIIESAKEAGSRIKDVYIGIDVWGRNFYGGGKLNTQEALKVVYKHGCSLAVFAPGWTHETLGDDDYNNVIMGECLPKHERFMIRDKALWDSLWPFLKTKLPCILPFQTSFCRGLGIKRRRYGEVISNDPWYNLRDMQYQPNCAHGPHGYLVSTDKNIHYISRLAFVTKGNLNFRQSLMHLIEKGNSEEKMISDDPKPSNDDMKIQIENESTSNSIETKEASDKDKVRRDDSEIKSHDENVFTGDRIDEELSQKDRKDQEVQESGSTRIPSSCRSVTQRRTVEQWDRQPHYEVAYISEEKECLQVWLDDSFNGGSCLKINPSDTNTNHHRIIRLFCCDFHVKAGENLVVCMVTKRLPEFQSQWLNLWLHATTENGTEIMKLVGQPETVNSRVSSASDTVYQQDVSSDEFAQLRRYLVAQEPEFYLGTGNLFGWNIMYFQVPCVSSLRVTSLLVRSGRPEGSILLGHVGLCARAQQTHVALCRSEIDKIRMGSRGDHLKIYSLEQRICS